jgi:hypothetical protein
MSMRDKKLYKEIVSGRPRALKRVKFRKREDEEEQWAMCSRRRRLAEQLRPKEDRGNASCRFALQGAMQCPMASSARMAMLHEPQDLFAQQVYPATDNSRVVGFSISVIELIRATHPPQWASRFSPGSLRTHEPLFLNR